MKAGELCTLVYHYIAVLSPLSVAQTLVDTVVFTPWTNMLVQPQKIG